MGKAMSNAIKEKRQFTTPLLTPRNMKYPAASKRAKSKIRDRFKKAMRTYFANRSGKCLMQEVR